MQWLEVDTSIATSTTVGIGSGPAFHSGDLLVSIGPKSPHSDYTVTWAPRP